MTRKTRKMHAHPVHPDWTICPECLQAVEPFSVHAHDAGEFRPEGVIERVDRWFKWATVALVFFGTVYFTAHILVAAGVACPAR